MHPGLGATAVKHPNIPLNYNSSTFWGAFVRKNMAQVLSSLTFLLNLQDTPGPPLVIHRAPHSPSGQWEKNQDNCFLKVE